MTAEEKLLCWDCNGTLKRVCITETNEESVLGSITIKDIPTHTTENLPEMIGDLAKALAEETTERENLERERDEAREARDALLAENNLLHEQLRAEQKASFREERDKLAEELKEAQDAIGLMLKDSSCRTIPRYAKEQLNIVTGRGT